VQKIPPEKDKMVNTSSITNWKSTKIMKNMRTMRDMTMMKKYSMIKTRKEIQRTSVIMMKRMTLRGALRTKQTS
jgi:hypothetical protein